MSGSRTPLLALALVGVAAGALLPPRTTRYKIETSTQQVVDLSGLGQGEQRNAFGMVNYLTITTNDSASGKTIHAVLDSIVKADSSPAIQQSMLDSARGRTWHAFMGPDGRLTNIQRVDSGDGGTEIIANFFPRFKAGARVGDSWTDTTETTSEEGPQNITTRTVTNYRVAGTEMRNGARALKLETSFSLSQSGEINQPGQTLLLDGTGSGTGTYYVTENGHYLGGENSLKSDILVTADQIPAPIPITTTSSSKVSVLP